MKICDMAAPVFVWVESANQINSSLSFLLANSFFIFCDAANSIALFRDLAWAGQTVMQRMQEMQRSESVSLGLSAGMAPTGHCVAHTPQPVQLLPAFGVKGTP